MEENKKNVWLRLSKQISQFRKIFVFTATQIVKGKKFLKINSNHRIFLTQQK